MNMNRRSFVGLFGTSVSAALLAGCSGNKATDDTTSDAATTDDIDYKVLVNKQHQLPEGWEDKLETVTFTNSGDWDVTVEAKGATGVVYVLSYPGDLDIMNADTEDLIAQIEDYLNGAA